jgi:hypothetical protein
MIHLLAAEAATGCLSFIVFASYRCLYLCTMAKKYNQLIITTLIATALIITVGWAQLMPTSVGSSGEAKSDISTLKKEDTTTGQPAQDTVTETADSLIFVEKLAIARNTSGSTQDKTLAVMRSFLEVPYVGGTLEAPGPERLIVNLRGLDCWTSVESALAVALTSNDPNGDFELYKYYLRTLRYWGGTVDGYGSRIHYFTGWMLQAEKLGFVEDRTAALGGRKLDKKVTYMTDNPTSYPGLSDSLARKHVLGAQERINAHTWYYIPKNKVAAMEQQIETGNIIVLTSSLHNLDVEHQGFAVRQPSGRVHLLHASSAGKKVLVSGKPLADYLSRIPAMSGIMVLKIN